MILHILATVVIHSGHQSKRNDVFQHVSKEQC